MSSLETSLSEYLYQLVFKSLSASASPSAVVVAMMNMTLFSNSAPSSLLPPSSQASTLSQHEYTSSTPPTATSTTSTSFNQPTLADILSDPTLLLRTLTAAELSMVFLPVACYWFYSTFLFTLSFLKFTSIELHRIPTSQPMRPKNRVSVAKVLATVAMQHVVQIGVAIVLAVATRVDVPVEMESLVGVVMKLFVGSLIMDTWQYWFHRLFHINRYLYRTVHSVHHQLTVPYAFGALYNHPLEGLIMDTLGGGIPALLLDMHPWTACLFFSIATLKTVDDHCGYAWDWSPARLFGGNGAEYHDIHHWGKGRMYNFSQPFYTFWDHLMGTEYHAAMAKKERVAKERVEEVVDNKELACDGERVGKEDFVLKRTLRPRNVLRKE